MILSMGVSHYRISTGRPPTSIPMLALAFSMVAVGAAGLVTVVAIPVAAIPVAAAIPAAVAIRVVAAGIRVAVAAAGTADADRGPHAGSKREPSRGCRIKEIRFARDGYVVSPT